MTYRAKCDARRMRMKGTVVRAAESYYNFGTPKSWQSFLSHPITSPSPYFILERRKRRHRRVATLGQWAQWLEHGNRRIAVDDVGPYRVSTIFLGIDHSFGRTKEPILYETLVFASDRDGSMDSRRYATWEEAERGHAEILANVTARWRTEAN